MPINNVNIESNDSFNVKKKKKMFYKFRNRKVSLAARQPFRQWLYFSLIFLISSLVVLRL